MPRRWAKIVAVVYAAGLVTASVLPPAAEGEGGWDTVVSPDVQNALHVPAYAALVILSAAALSANRSRAVRFVAVALGCVALGAALEWVQAYIPGRFGSLTDGLMNVAGVALGVLMLLMRRRCAVCSLVTRGLGCPPPSEDTPTEPR